MQKQAPTLGRLLVMVAFALSCFGLLLFLWLSFGGAIPLKPGGYRLKVAFPEATQLAMEADVRVAGVSVGKVRGKELDPRGGNRTLATIEVDRKFAPVHSDAHAILRQKTLLGETYVELTPGSPRSPYLKEDGRLGNAQVEPTVELDEIFQALDPGTRQAFHIWQQDLARTITGRGQDFSDALGNLPAFAANGSALLKVLNDQSQDVTKLFRNTGTVFEALSRNSGQLHNLITNSEDVFGATAAQNESLARTFAIFPTFLDESRATMARLQTFAHDTDPLIRDLRPVAQDLGPTLHSVRLLAPDLRRLFANLSPLIEVSRKGLPALRDTLTGARPLLGATGPFLSQLNPILQFLELYQKQTSDFLGHGAHALAAKTATNTPGGVGHYLRQQGPNGIESAGIFGTKRAAINRGNAYNPPTYAGDPETARRGIYPEWDCANAGGPKPPTTGPSGSPPCWVAPTVPFQGQNLRYPHVNAANYGR
jgi:virulence factor Mce-like protein